MPPGPIESCPGPAAAERIVAFGLTGKPFGTGVLGLWEPRSPGSFGGEFNGLLAFPAVALELEIFNRWL